MLRYVPYGANLRVIFDLQIVPYVPYRYTLHNIVLITAIDFGSVCLSSKVIFSISVDVVLVVVAATSASVVAVAVVTLLLMLLLMMLLLLLEVRIRTDVTVRTVRCQPASHF